MHVRKGYDNKIHSCKPLIPKTDGSDQIYKQGMESCPKRGVFIESFHSVAHLRMTRVVSRAALTLVSTLLSAPFNILPTQPFSNEELLLNQSTRCKHWLHP